MRYVPPHTVSPKAVSLIAEISMNAALLPESERVSLRLRRTNRLRSIQSSLSIENNSLTLGQVTDVIGGKRVLGDPREITEAKNAFDSYALIGNADPCSIDDLLTVHGIMMRGLLDDAGRFRRNGIGIYAGKDLVHLAPPPDMVPSLMGGLFAWLRDSDEHPLVKGCVFHYEFEFIHPFSDGNGRTGRLWHALILSRWVDAFEWIPVETVVRERQQEYYDAIGRSTSAGDSGPFLDFMLEAIRDAVLDARSAEIRGRTRLTETESSVLAMIRENRFGSAADAASVLSVSSRTVERALSKLKDLGFIARVGGNKTGVWIVQREP